MKLKQIFKSKRGVAIENAIMFMIVIFFLCALITSLTLLGFHEVKLEKALLLRDVEIDQIGEDFLASIEAKQAFNETYDKYAYKVDGNVLKVWREKDTDKTVVLYVEAELTADNQVNVKAWRYSELPTQTE
ncbi:MAG: hypothetical protein IJF26_05675 [Clostridia bacterium]|nr:hypothetical protein [Clostridia bacterium]